MLNALGKEKLPLRLSTSASWCWLLVCASVRNQCCLKDNWTLHLVLATQLLSKWRSYGHLGPQGLATQVRKNTPLIATGRLSIGVSSGVISARVLGPVVSPRRILRVGGGGAERGGVIRF